MGADEKAYVANRFALELDAKDNIVGFVSAVDGAHFKSNPVKQMVGNTNNVTIYSGKPTYDDINITVGMAMSRKFWDWISKSMSLPPRPERRTGALVGYDFNMCERSRREFQGAMISQVKFPQLDPRSKTPATMQITISVEHLSFGKGDMSKAPQATGNNEIPKQKRWLSSGFRFEIDRFKGDESLTTLSVDSFVFKKNIIQQNIGYELETRKAMGRIEMPQLVVCFPEHKGAEWIKWYDKAVVKGNRFNETTTGHLTYFSTDKQELMRLEMNGISLASLEVDKYDSKKTDVANMTATLNIESLSMVPGVGTV